MSLLPWSFLPPSADVMGFDGEGGRQWDFNVDTLCKRFVETCIAFVQPHSWEKLEFDEEKRVLATTNNT